MGAQESVKMEMERHLDRWGSKSDIAVLMCAEEKGGV